jgi:hypothetical protein
MDRRVIRVLTAGALTMFAITACCAQQVLYVDAQRGSDLHDGTQAKPFASLARARDAVRALKKGECFSRAGRGHRGVRQLFAGDPKLGAGSARWRYWT